MNPSPSEQTNPTKESQSDTKTNTSGSKPARRRRIIRRRGGNAKSKTNQNAIPDSLSQNPALLSAISNSLPSDYEFEVIKTIWRIQQSQAKHVALQMPEGLLMYACSIADILRTFCTDSLKSVSVLGDVTYGACCIDDLGAKALGADLLVHYGHSCLVPLTTTAVPCLYVFVEIRVDVMHLVECFCKTCEVGTRVHVMGTVQFRSTVAAAAKLLNEKDRPATIPQAKPLSPGEVLGCTAPSGLGDTPTDSSCCKNKDGGNGACASKSTSCEQDIDVDKKDGESDGVQKTEHVMLFIADGRFHLEAAMIANPSLRALRYDPYSKELTEERYETEKMKSIRLESIQKVRDPSIKTFGIVLGTLGRQGNPSILGHVKSLLRKHGKRSFVLLLSEIFPQKLESMKSVDAWVQIACPRLSVDWGHFFKKPLLSVYELNVALKEESYREIYPMDFYQVGSGRWTNYHEENRQRKIHA